MDDTNDSSLYHHLQFPEERMHEVGGRPHLYSENYLLKYFVYQYRPRMYIPFDTYFWFNF